jgi:hypothetical protein
MVNPTRAQSQQFCRPALICWRQGANSLATAVTKFYPDFPFGKSGLEIMTSTSAYPARKRRGFCCAFSILISSSPKTNQKFLMEIFGSREHPKTPPGFLERTQNEKRCFHFDSKSKPCSFDFGWHIPVPMGTSKNQGFFEVQLLTGMASNVRWENSLETNYFKRASSASSRALRAAFALRSISSFAFNS